MLDLISLDGDWRELTDLIVQADLGSQATQFQLTQMCPVAIAAPTIRRNHQTFGFIA